MCNCNSSFCAVCCRRVKAYRFDNVPEITGDLQLYTEFYKVGEAYGHWKFTIDDLEAYLDIPTVLWQDKLVAFGHTATGGLFYDTSFIFDYSTLSFTIGNSINTGQYSASIGESNLLTGDFSLIVGASNVTNTAHSAVFGKANSILGSYNSIFGEANNINGNGNNVFGTGNIVGDNSNIFGASLDTNGFYGNAMFSDQTGGSLAIANDAFTAQFAGGYRFRLDASSTAVNISSTGIVTIDNVVNNNAEDQLLVWNSTTKEVEYRDVSSLPGGGGGSGTVTSVDAAFLNGTALTVVGGAITTAGTFDFEWQGLNTDYVAGDGSIIAFPTLTSGTVTSVSAGNGMTFTTITTSGAVTLGTPSSITLASTNSVGVGTHSHLFAPGGTTAQYIRGDGTLATTPLGSVTSVGMTITAATALSVAGSPITTSGTFAVTWTGSNTQYVAGDGSLITFPTLTSGTVTAVNSGAGMDFTNFTTSGTIILGTPSTITLSSTNAATGTTHSHEFDLGGSAGQYLAGDNTLQTFPTIPVVTWADKRITFGKTATNGLDFSNDLMFDYTTSSLAINHTGGSISPTNAFDVYADLPANAAFQLNTASGSSATQRGLFNIQKSRGTIASPTALVNGDKIGSFGFIGYDGSNNQSGALLEAFVDGAVSSGLVPKRLSFVTGSSSGTRAERMVIKSNGKVGIGTNAPNTLLHVTGELTVGTINNDNALTNILVETSGLVKYRTVASLPFTNNTGTVTAVNSGAGMDFTNFTTSGTIIMGNTSPITLISTGTPTGTTHSHALNLGGTSGQYLAGDNTLQTFPTIPTVTPSALTKTDDTNILLNLTGTPSTSLLQAVDIAVAWSGLLSYTRGGTGLGTLGTANQLLRVNAGATALEYFTPTWTSNTGTVTNFSANDLTTGYTYPLFTVNVTNPTTTPDLTFSLPSLPQKFVFAAPWGVTGTPLWRQLLPSDLQADGASTGQVIAWNGTAWVPSAAGGGYWSRSGTVLYTTTSADAVVINTATSNSALARLNVGELGYTAANYQSNIGLHQTDTYGIDKGVSISGYPQAGGPYLGVGKIGFYKENATLNNQDTYFSISTRTGASNVTVDSTKFKISGAGLVTITNIPSSSSSINLVVSNSGTLESRTIASLAYYTAGTGISIAGSVITNTLPSKWQIIGALYLTPSVSAYDIATPITGSIGYVTMTKGTASQCGYFEVRTAAAARVGYIGYQTGYMNYSSDIGNHRFNGGTVQINNIPSGSTSLNILTTNGGVVETRTIASLTGLPSSVWYLQGGTTASTNTSQNIYRTGDVWLNTGSTGAGGYKFRVTGDSYFEAQQYFAYATYQVWRNSANNAWLNGIRYNTSNQLELGQSSFDIYLPGYTSSRSVDTKTLLDKTLFVNSSGVVKSESSEWVRNDGASCWITSTESHLADNTNRRVTFDVSASTSNTYYTFSYSSGDYKMFFPGSYSQHLVICTLEYTTSGTPTVTATLRKTSTVVETNISTSADGRKVMTIHAIMSGTSSDYPTLYIYNATGGASITLQKCKITMIPLGETPP